MKRFLGMGIHEAVEFSNGKLVISAGQAINIYPAVAAFALPSLLHVLRDDEAPTLRRFHVIHSDTVHILGSVVEGAQFSDGKIVISLLAPYSYIAFCDSMDDWLTANGDTMENIAWEYPE